jgi:hypothetical protein
MSRFVVLHLSEGLLPRCVAHSHPVDEGGVLGLLPPCESDQYHQLEVMELVSIILCIMTV